MTIHSIDDNLGLPKPYLVSRVLANAPWAQKVPCFLRHRRDHPVWRPVHFSAVLQISGAPPLPPASGRLAALRGAVVPSSRPVLAHLFSIVAGIGRVENTKTLKLNGLFPHLLGLPDFPHRDTLRQFLWRFDAQTLRDLKATHDLLRLELFQRLGLLWNAVVVMDATQLTVYGRQEGATVGYNKAHKGKASYSPLLSNEGRC